MATQDIAVDGWALTMLSKKNRGRGPVCNSIGQNLGYFLSFVGFLALNDGDSSEKIWRPLLGLPPSTKQPPDGLVSLGGFVRFMGYFMIVTTTAVAVFKREHFGESTAVRNSIHRDARGIAADEDVEALLASDRLSSSTPNKKKDDDAVIPRSDLDASEIGLKETYHRLWAVCQLPAVQTLFLLLLTYRLPTALSDNVKFLKAVENGLSKSTTALLSPTVVLPIGILVPIVATKFWHGHPLKQFMAAYKVRVTLVPLLDMLMLVILKQRANRELHHQHSFLSSAVFWSVLVLSTAAQAIANTLQFNAQMTFFAHRVDPAIGGSYMTLLNTAANLGGTWPASFVMWLVSRLTPVQSRTSRGATDTGNGNGFNDPYFALQFAFSGLGLLWIWFLGKRVDRVAALPDDAWRTHLLDADTVRVSPNELGIDGGGDNNNNKAKYVAAPSSSESVDVELAADGGYGGAAGWIGRQASSAASTLVTPTKKDYGRRGGGGNPKQL